MSALFFPPSSLHSSLHEASWLHPYTKAVFAKHTSDMLLLAQLETLWLGFSARLALAVSLLGCFTVPLTQRLSLSPSIQSICSFCSLSREGTWNPVFTALHLLVFLSWRGWWQSSFLDDDDKQMHSQSETGCTLQGQRRWALNPTSATLLPTGPWPTCQSPLCLWGNQLHVTIVRINSLNVCKMHRTVLATQ